MSEHWVLQPRFDPGTYKEGNVMLLLHQTLNHHLKLVAQTPTRIIHQVLISYSNTSDCNSSLLHEVKVSSLNEPQYVDLTTEREKTGTKEQRKKNSRSI